MDSKDKVVDWLGSTLEDLRALPLDVRHGLGYKLYAVQQGDRPQNVKTYSGSIQELRENDDQNKTYRLVYVAAFEEAIYVLHVFNKKSTQGIATSKQDQELIKARFKEAERKHRERKKP